VFLSRYRGYSLCSACGGTRLRAEARQVKIDGKNICQVCSMTVEEAARFFGQLRSHDATSRDCRKAADRTSGTPALSQRSRP
jgi:excinuclease UvrABC ATPase subunit